MSFASGQLGDGILERERVNTTIKSHLRKCISSLSFPFFALALGSTQRLSLVPHTLAFLRAGVALLQRSEINQVF